MGISKIERDCLGKRIANFYNKKNKNSSETYKHFTEEGIPRRTIANVLARLKLTGTYITKSPTGRPMKKSNFECTNKIKLMLKKNPSISNRKCAAKVKIPTTTYRRIVSKKLGLKTFKKIKAPKYINNQKQRAKKGCSKIYRNISGNNDTVLIMDDETYVCQDPMQNKMQRYYKAQSKNQVENDHNIQPVQKFPKKYMIWQAVDENGNFSDSFIFEGTINSEIYLQNCLKERLLPFIKKYHENKKILFWPDLATSHYANDCISFLDEQNINYVKKKDNPPNVPQARPIETLWAIMKRRYAQRQKGAKNLKSFKQIWKNISLQVSNECGKSVMATTRKKLRAIGRKGVYSTFK